MAGGYWGQLSQLLSHPVGAVCSWKSLHGETAKKVHPRKPSANSGFDPCTRPLAIGHGPIMRFIFPWALCRIILRGLESLQSIGSLVAAGTARLPLKIRTIEGPSSGVTSSSVPRNTTLEDLGCRV